MSTPTAISAEACNTAILNAKDWPNTDHLICEDGAPVDGIYSELQMRLLTESLGASWSPGQPFMACANVGVFFVNKNPAIVPDVFVSLGVERLSDRRTAAGKSYLIWVMGKPPDIVIEVVSNTHGGELTYKRRIYEENVQAPNYVVWDPEEFLKSERLQAFNHVDGVYQPTQNLWFPNVGLGLRLWRGVYEGFESEWLHWFDTAGTLLATGLEQRKSGEAAKRQAKAAERHAKAAERRAKKSDERSERLAAKLRALGLDPDEAN